MYVVTWEYQQSENGEVCGVVGIARTEVGARRLAEAEAREFAVLQPGRTVYIAGEEWPPRDGHNPKHSGRDWDIWIEWNAFPVSE